MKTVTKFLSAAAIAVGSMGATTVATVQPVWGRGGEAGSAVSTRMQQREPPLVLYILLGDCVERRETVLIASVDVSAAVDQRRKRVAFNRAGQQRRAIYFVARVVLSARVE